MQYILGSLNNNCDKQQKELENAALVIHTKHQHLGLYIIKETSHFLNYGNSQYIEACLYVGIRMQFRKEKKITRELLNFFKITEQEKQH